MTQCNIIFPRDRRHCNFLLPLVEESLFTIILHQ